MEVLADDEEYEEILEDMREECCKFGMHIMMKIYLCRLGQTICCLAEKKWSYHGNCYYACF